MFLQNNQPLPYQAFTTGVDDIATRLRDTGFMNVLGEMSKSGIDHMEGFKRLVGSINAALFLAGIQHIRLTAKDWTNKRRDFATKPLLLMIAAGNTDRDDSEDEFVD
jgi:hypothetical protein